MSDLIERDKAIAKTFCTTVDGVPRMAVLLDDIKAIPSARHREGKWMEAGRMTQFNRFYYFRYCSKCFYARDDCDSEKDTNFCPNCGARMKGADDE